MDSVTAEEAGRRQAKGAGIGTAAAAHGEDQEGE